MELLPFAAYADNRVRLLSSDNKTWVGEVVNYTSAADNEPDPESITLACDGFLYEFFPDDIVSIEAL